MSEAEHTIAAGLLQKPTRIAEVGGLLPEVFQDLDARAIVGLARGYHDRNGGKNSMDTRLAQGVLERSTAKSAAKLLKVVDEYATFQPITDSEFRDALAVAIKDRRGWVLREHGAAALEAAVGGDHDAAAHALRQGLLAADDVDIDDDHPTDIRSPEEISKGHQEADAPEEERIAFHTGFDRIEAAVRFCSTEQLVLGGYAADGKTQFTKTICYNANRKGANVLFVAMEMTKQEVRTLFVAHHAHTLDRRGVKWTDILNKQASTEDLKRYHAALDDFQIKEHEDGSEIETNGGGKLFIWSPKKTIKMAHYCARARAMKEEHGLNISVGDYLELIEPDHDYGQYRLNIKAMCEQGKSLARTTGILNIFPHQISRAGRDVAEKRKPPYYLMRDFGESAGVERAADIMGWIFSDEDLRHDRQAIVGLAKCRKGRTIVQGFRIYADYERGYMGQLRTAAEAGEE